MLNRALPSGKESTVTRLVTMDGDLPQAVAGQSITVTLKDEIDVSRGDVLTKSDAPAAVADMAAPTFDVLRVEPDGSVLIAGNAAADDRRRIKAPATRHHVAIGVVKDALAALRIVAARQQRHVARLPRHRLHRRRRRRRLVRLANDVNRSAARQHQRLIHHSNQNSFKRMKKE